MYYSLACLFTRTLTGRADTHLSTLQLSIANLLSRHPVYRTGVSRGVPFQRADVTTLGEALKPAEMSLSK
jgi:hypothetical protein